MRIQRAINKVSSLLYYIIYSYSSNYYAWNVPLNVILITE